MFSGAFKFFVFLFFGLPIMVLAAIAWKNILIFRRAKNLQNQNMNIYTYIKGLKNFNARRVYVDAFGKTAIGFSEDKRKLLRAEFHLNEKGEPYISSPRLLKIYDMSQVISIDLIENTVTKTSTSGYTMFSDTWVFANSTSKDQIQELQVKVLFDDRQNPSFYITLFKMPFPTQDYISWRKDTKAFLAVAQDLYTDLNYLMHKSKQEQEAVQKQKAALLEAQTSPVLPNSSETVKASQADDPPKRVEEQKGDTSLIESIERISHLKSQGLITEEEFVLLKTKLLTTSTPPEA